MDHVAVAQINQSTRRMRLALITAIVNVQDKQTVEGSVGDTMWNMTNISGPFMSYKCEKSLLQNKIHHMHKYFLLQRSHYVSLPQN